MMINHFGGMYHFGIPETIPVFAHSKVSSRYMLYGIAENDSFSGPISTRERWIWRAQGAIINCKLQVF